MPEKDMKFCKFLHEQIRKSGMTHSEFYSKLGIGKPYFYDILGGKVKPPPPDKQFAIIDILKLDSETAIILFELAGSERNEIPADIAKYLNEHTESRMQIRDKIYL